MICLGNVILPSLGLQCVLVNSRLFHFINYLNSCFSFLNYVEDKKRLEMFTKKRQNAKNNNWANMY